MLSTPADPARLLAAVAATADLAGCGGMVAGQGAELASPPEPIDPGRLDYINRGKTGALLTASLLSAAHLCGSTEERHGIVLAKSELAKRAGVKTGMVNWEAK